jgi:hypothetical protein
MRQRRGTLAESACLLEQKQAETPDPSNICVTLQSNLERLQYDRQH